MYNVTTNERRWSTEGTIIDIIQLSCEEHHRSKNKLIWDFVLDSVKLNNCRAIRPRCLARFPPRHPAQYTFRRSTLAPPVYRNVNLFDVPEWQEPQGSLAYRY